MESRPKIAECTANGIVYRYMTDDEIAQMHAEEEEYQRAEATRMPTEEERLAAMEDALAEMMGVMLND